MTPDNNARLKMLGTITTLPSGDHFVMQEDGLYFQPPPSPNGSTPARLYLSGPFEAVASISSLDRGLPNPGVLLRIPAQGGDGREVSVLRAELQGDALEVRRQLAAHGLAISTNRRARDLFVEFLNSTRPEAFRWHTNTSGWKQAHRSFVLPGQPSIVAGGEGVHFIGGDESLIYETKGSLAEWKKHVAEPCVGNPLLMFAIAVALSGPLISLLGAEGGGFHLMGPSSSGKSTALWGAASAWGKGGSDGFATTWRATSNALEGVASVRNDTLLALDELGRCNPESVGRTIYVLSDGQGKERMHADASLRARARWRCALLSTGELSIEAILQASRHQIQVRAGQELRILTLSTEREGMTAVIENIHGASSASSFVEAFRTATTENYGHAGPALVRALIENDDHATWVRKFCNDFRDSLRWARDSAQTQRASWKFALAAAAGELAIRLGILPWRPGAAADVCETFFESWADSFGREKNREAHNIIETVRHHLSANSNTAFWPIQVIEDADKDADPETPRRAEGNSRGSFMGYRHDDRNQGLLFLVPRSVMTKTICRGYDATTIARALDEAGFLVTNDKQASGKKRYRYRKAVNGTKEDFIAVKAAILDGD